MSKKNIGATLALYPCLAAHSHLTVSLVQAHYINKGIHETENAPSISSSRRNSALTQPEIRRYTRANLRGERAKFALETRRLYGKIAGGVQTALSRAKTTTDVRVETFNNSVT